MRYKKTHITVKRTNPKTYPGLYTKLPYSSKIKDKEWLYKKKEEIVINIAEYLLHNPKNLIVFKNKLSEEERDLRVTLDTLVRGHNLSLKLGLGGKFFRLRKARKILKTDGE